jgi:hypothetical protein
MESPLTLFSVVVLGEVHNPTILNPDFLAVRGIVPKEWCDAIKVTQTLTTPPFAVVAYSNGISVVVENEKLQVSDASQSVDPTRSPVIEIASKYVGTLPHVKYRAVGVNFQSIATPEAPTTYIKQRFIRQGPWDADTMPLNTAGVSFVYPISDGGRVKISLDVGEQVAPTGEQEAPPVIVMNANFHRECHGYPADKQVVSYLSRIEEDWSRYKELIAAILG